MGHTLEKYYNGNNWNSFKYVFDKIWEDSEEQRLSLQELNNDIEIAKVIWGHLENNGRKWIISEVPGLDYLKPIDCKGNVELEKRLKTLLMRLPT